MSNFHLRTEIEIQEISSKIRYSDKILSLGSCFSVEIADKIKSLNYQVLQNPAGITFNPRSIETTVKSIISGNSLPDTSLDLVNGLWSHSDFHGSYNGIDKDEVILNINNSIAKSYDFLKNVNFVFLTLGTAFVFQELASQKIVNNCHKRPNNLFERKLLSVSEIFNSLTDIKTNLDAHSNNEVQYIVTLSPVRHIRDGLTENMLSKSTSLLAIQEFVKTFKSVHYFPSYEIMIDDLRDYRFYKNDYIHPNGLALQYIYQKFEKFGLGKSEENIRKMVSNIKKRENHKALFPDSQAHKDFLTKLESDKIKLSKSYSWMWA